MPKYKGLELSDEEFNELYRQHDKARKYVEVDKETFGKLLRDHSTLHGLAKPEALATDKE